MKIKLSIQRKRNGYDGLIMSRYQSYRITITSVSSLYSSAGFNLISCALKILYYIDIEFIDALYAAGETLLSCFWALFPSFPEYIKLVRKTHIPLCLEAAVDYIDCKKNTVCMRRWYGFLV